MHNNKHNNGTLPQLTENITRWHHDRNLVDGATDWSQTKKLLEEFIEIVAAQMPEQDPVLIAKQVRQWTDELLASGRIKSVSVHSARDAFEDAIGDMFVVQTNLAERNKISMSQAIDGAYQEIRDRKGKMVGGTFVKEEDLESKSPFSYGDEVYSGESIMVQLPEHMRGES